MPTTLVKHPILADKLARLRDKKTSSTDFRRILQEISCLLAYESTRDLELQNKTLETPLGNCTGEVVKNAPIVVSILRAGNGMLDGMLNMLPFASSGQIGIYRDKFIKNTVEYYFRLPKKVAGKTILLIDPIVATADTAIASLDRLKQYKIKKVKLICVLISREGERRVAHFHPDVEIITLGNSEELNEIGHLIPGIGDVGGRLYQVEND